ncbi:MAG: hypothetical protein KBB52_05955, partial [Candidatus Omnitrophica bacterium]|nr:hypothetical protein [Candidatus Omnitrophota bacterium]
MSVVLSLRASKRKEKSDKRASPDNGFTLQGENGSLVILIHGLTGTPNEMRFLANYFNKKGYSVICPRLANHGEPLCILKKTKWQAFYNSVREVLKRES